MYKVKTEIKNHTLHIRARSFLCRIYDSIFLSGHPTPHRQGLRHLPLGANVTVPSARHHLRTANASLKKQIGSSPICSLFNLFFGIFNLKSSAVCGEYVECDVGLAFLFLYRYLTNGFDNLYPAVKHEHYLVLLVCGVGC